MLRVRQHGPRTGKGSCMGFSTVDSDRGMGAVWGSGSWTVVREDGRGTGFSTMDSEWQWGEQERC